MFEMKNPYFDDQPYAFFEPRPSDMIDDSTLEGCLRHASRVEQLIDSANLYLCEPCTIDRYGKRSSKKHRTQALKRLLMIDPPKNLIINLKRFQSSGGLSFSKNSKRISFPLILAIDDYMIHKIPRSDTETILLYKEASDDRTWTPRYQY